MLCVGCDLSQSLPCRCATGVSGGFHVNAQQRPLSDGAGGELILSYVTEPTVHALMVDVGVHQQGHQDIAVRPPGYA